MVLTVPSRVLLSTEPGAIFNYKGLSSQTQDALKKTFTGRIDPVALSSLVAKQGALQLFLYRRAVDMLFRADLLRGVKVETSGSTIFEFCSPSFPWKQSRQQAASVALCESVLVLKSQGAITFWNLSSATRCYSASPILTTFLVSLLASANADPETRDVPDQLKDDVTLLLDLGLVTGPATPAVRVESVFSFAEELLFSYANDLSKEGDFSVISDFRSQQRPDIRYPQLRLRDALKKRRSRRSVGHKAITKVVLYDFLHLVTGTSLERPVDTAPYPRAGGIIADCLYLVVRRAHGVPLGIYLYKDSLSKVNELPAGFDATIGIEHSSWYPDILLYYVVDFRPLRIRYPLEAGSLAAIQWGCVAQTMYLVAAELNLAACILGLTGVRRAMRSVLELQDPLHHVVGGFALSSTA